MSCLIQAHGSDQAWFNIDAIQTTYISQSGGGIWDVDYYGQANYAKQGSEIYEEEYPTKDDAEARMRFIEKMVNSACGTTTFRIKKLK